jgi:hypothetical protein
VALAAQNRGRGICVMSANQTSGQCRKIRTDE